jgi:DNA-binding MarR family transcriptional regulator
MIVSKTSKKDKRSELLELTSEGKQLILESDILLSKVIADYKELVGEKDLEIAVNVLNKLISYHENLNEFDENDLGD